MAQYEVQGKFFDGEMLHEEIGSIIELPDDVEPPTVLKPLDLAAKRAVEKREEKDKAFKERLRASGIIAPIVSAVNDVVQKEGAVSSDVEPAPKKRKTANELLATNGED